MTCRRMGRLWLLPAALLLAAAFGCGSGRYPVSGTVTYEDGSRLEEGIVAGEATVDGRLVAVQGNVQKDGSFQWGTERAGDGAYPGKYRVIVLSRALGDAETALGMLPAVDPMFSKPETSGIDFEVKPGKNELPITVTRPKQSRR